MAIVNNKIQSLSSTKRLLCQKKSLSMAMKDCHRMFLQSFMSRGILNANDVFDLLKQCSQRYGELVEDRRQTLLSYVHLINDKIRVFGMEIKKVINEVDGTSHYGLVNTTETSITLLVSTFTDNELQFFKKLVEMIVMSDDGTAGSISAVNISDTLTKKMSKHDAEHLLDRFVRDKWLGKLENGRIYLGTRGILELEQYIIDMYGENAVRCNICKKLCVQGENCDHCDTRLHQHCAKMYFKDPSVKCPECQSAWTKTHDQEPQPSTSAEVEDMATQPSSSATQSSRKRSAK